MAENKSPKKIRIVKFFMKETAKSGKLGFCVKNIIEFNAL